jgi:hypothetical protein
MLGGNGATFPAFSLGSGQDGLFGYWESFAKTVGGLARYE